MSRHRFPGRPGTASPGSDLPPAPGRAGAFRVAVAAFVTAAAAVLAGTAPASAIAPKYWIHDSSEEFLEGEVEGVSVMSEGTLRLAPKVNALAEPDVPYIWDVAVGPGRGDAYLGTGDDGWILRVRGGTASEFFQCAAFEVLAVTVGPGGRVFAGTAPEGFVYRIDRDGEGEVLFDADEAYVWDLAFGPDGALYVAVGPGGAVYRVDPETGKAERFFETEDNHVVCLAFDDAGNLLLGTEGRGLVVRVSPSGKARVLHDCPQAEVGAVLAGPEGTVWAAAAAPSDAREEARRESSEQADSNGDDDAEDSPRDFLFEITVGSDGDGSLYRIDPDGDAFHLWDSGQGAIFDLALARDGSVLAATGEDGAVYAVREDGRATLVLDADEDQVVSLAPLPGDGDYLLGTANPSRLLRMAADPRREGTYVSEVLDAGRLAEWGRIEWTGEENGGRVELEVRAGNTENPDGTWTDWTGRSRERSVDLEIAKARFFQWRVTLKGDGKATPLVRRVRVSSLENNLPPIVDDVEIVPAGNRFYDEVPELRPRPLYQALPGGVKVQYQFDHGTDQEFPPEQRAPWTQGLRQIRWEAIDPNGDFLVYDLAFRREDESRWKEFASDIEGKHYTFNTNGVPDGTYRIRVTASDRRHNPDQERTASRISEVFVVDNTAPGFRDIRHRRDGDRVRITGRVVDELSDVIRLEYSVDGDDWVDRAPADGIFDSPTESIDLDVDAPSGEEHSVLLRGTDNAGNLGATRVLIEP